jgi:hypothetical protein
VLRRDLTTWQKFVLADVVLLLLCLLAFFGASLVDAVFDLQWGLGWSAFLLLLALLPFSLLLSVLVLAAHGLFEPYRIRSVEELRLEAEAKSRKSSSG